MAETSSALFDFTISGFADVDFEALAGQLADLASRHGPHPPIVELFGKPATGEILVLLRFSLASYSGALRAQLAALAQRLKGRLTESSQLTGAERAHAQEDRIAGFEVRIDATERPREGVAAFRERMGLQAGTPSYQLRFDSGDDIAAAWARSVAEGSFFVGAKRVPRVGDSVSLLLVAPDVGALSASGFVLQVETGEAPGFLALIAPSDGLQAFLARRAAAGHRGRRRLPEGGRRRDPRYETCLDIEFAGYPELSGEFASNISKGGLFIRSNDPPPMRARVQLRVKLPNGNVAETEAEVVHRVSPEDAQRLNSPPGVGVCFVGENSAFEQKVAEFLAALPPRPPRVLLVDDDRLFRGVLADALRSAGMEVDTAASGEEGLQKLTQQLFDLDLVGLELHMPGLDGYCLIDRIRRLGGEMDLRVVVLSAAEQDELDALKGADAANDCIRKGTPLGEMVRRIQRVLGESVGDDRAA